MDDRNNCKAKEEKIQDQAYILPPSCRSMEFWHKCGNLSKRKRKEKKRNIMVITHILPSSGHDMICPLTLAFIIRAVGVVAKDWGRESVQTSPGHAYTDPSKSASSSSSALPPVNVMEVLALLNEVLCGLGQQRLQMPEVSHNWPSTPFLTGDDWGWSLSYHFWLKSEHLGWSS